jgi:hypothetical protein
MIDPDLRRRLSQNLRRLVTGRMTNDAFDDVYYGDYIRSQDRAVAAIAEFAWGLYSSDVLMAYCLKGRHAVANVDYRTAARSVLFLRSGLEYSWPEQPRLWSTRLLGAFALSLGLPGGIALLICSVPLLAMGIEDVEFLWPLAALGLISTLVSGWYLSNGGYQLQVKSLTWRNWIAAGDFDVWPFIRREDFYEARRTAHLLGVCNSAEVEH